jgi:hypothetical protein
MSAPVSIDDSRIQKQGWLEKLGGKHHSWTRRYFILYETILHYFKDDKRKECLGSIPLTNCTVTKEQLNEGPGFYFVIRVPQGSTKRTDFVCRASSEADREAWMGEITRGTVVTIFESTLSTALRVNPRKPGTYLPIPFFIVKALAYLEDGLLDVEGIYRLNGGQAKIESIQKIIDQNVMPDFSDVHSATGIVKLYMRTLSHPLFQFKNLPALRSIVNLTEEDQIMPIRQILRDLPIPNYVLLAFLFQHLLRVAEHEENNKMNTRAITVCIGPSLIWAESSLDAVTDSNVQQTLCTTLLNNFEQLFGTQPLMSYGSAGQMSINKLIEEQDTECPFTLNAPIGSIVHKLSEDELGWTICVFNDQWGVVHKKSLGPVESPKELLRGLGAQTAKWQLPLEQVARLSETCPEAVELYERLSTEVNALRERAAQVQ